MNQKQQLGSNHGEAATQAHAASSLVVPKDIKPLPQREIAGRIYEAARNKVIEEGDLDAFMARAEAFQWHWGQMSALYSFASTDCTVWSEEHRENLISEIESAIASVEADPNAERFYTSWTSVVDEMRERRQSGTPEADWGSPRDAGLESLDNLLAVAKAMPVHPDGVPGPRRIEFDAAAHPKWKAHKWSETYPLKGYAPDEPDCVSAKFGRLTVTIREQTFYETVLSPDDPSKGCWSYTVSGRGPNNEDAHSGMTPPFPELDGALAYMEERHRRGLLGDGRVLPEYQAWSDRHRASAEEAVRHYEENKDKSDATHPSSPMRRKQD